MSPSEVSTPVSVTLALGTGSPPAVVTQPKTVASSTPLPKSRRAPLVRLTRLWLKIAVGAVPTPDVGVITNETNVVAAFAASTRSKA